MMTLHYEQPKCSFCGLYSGGATGDCCCIIVGYDVAPSEPAKKILARLSETRPWEKSNQLIFSEKKYAKFNRTLWNLRTRILPKTWGVSFVRESVREE